MKSPIGNGTVESIIYRIELEIKESELKQQSELKNDENKEVKAQIIEEGELLPMRKRGMSLEYVAPIIEQGKPTAQLSDGEIANEVAKWKNSVILYVIGESPTITYLRKYPKDQCVVEGLVEIFYHNEGYFLIRFEERKDKDKMLFEGSYTLANRLVIIKEWVADFCFKKEVLKEISLLVRLPNLPLQCWSNDLLSRIGSV